MHVVLTIPDSVVRQSGDTPETIGRHLLEDAVIERYRAGLLSQRQVGEALGLDYWKPSLLQQRGVLLEDSATLDRIAPAS